MAARNTPGERLGFLTRKHGIKIDSPSSVEEISLAVGRKIGHDNVLSASRMNSAAVLFLASVELVNEMVESGVVVEEVFSPVLPLSSPSKKVMLSNVPPFISNDVLTEALSRYGKVVSPPKMIPLATKSPLLKHVVSFRRFAYIILKDKGELELSLNVKVDDFNYMIYATTNNMKCFGCGQLGHLARNCPDKAKTDNANSKEGAPREQSHETPNTGNDEAPGEGGSGEGEGAGDVNGEAGMPPPTETPEDGGSVAHSPDLEMPAAAAQGNIDLMDQIINDVIGDPTTPMETETVFKIPTKKRAHPGSKEKPKKKNTSPPAEYDAESESDYASDCSVTCSLPKSGYSQQSYNLEDIKAFLSKTKHARNVMIDHFFPDVEQFIDKTTQFMSEGGFEDREIWRLKKILGKLRETETFSQP